MYPIRTESPPRCILGLGFYAFTVTYPKIIPGKHVISTKARAETDSPEIQSKYSILKMAFSLLEDIADEGR